MDKTKQTMAIALVAVLAVVAGGWFLLISPQRSNVTSLHARTSSQESTNASLQAKISALKAELVQLPGARAQLEAVARRLPPDLAEVSLLRTLSKAAADANVDLQVITPGAATAVGAPAAAVATTSSATTASGTSPSATTSAPAPGAGAPAVVPVAAGPAGTLYAVPIALTVSGDYFDLEMFVHNLEGMQRALLVNSLTFTKPTLTVDAGATVGVTATATAAPGKGTSKHSKSTGKTTTGTAGKGKAVPGSVAAAQKEVAGTPPFVADQNTLTVTIAASVFSLYTTTPPAAAVPTAAPTSAPTK